MRTILRGPVAFCAPFTCSTLSFYEEATTVALRRRGYPLCRRATALFRTALFRSVTTFCRRAATTATATIASSVDRGCFGLTLLLLHPFLELQAFFFQQCLFRTRDGSATISENERRRLELFEFVARPRLSQTPFVSK